MANSNNKNTQQIKNLFFFKLYTEVSRIFDANKILSI